MSEATDKHYRFGYKGVKIDPYRIMEVYGITNAAQQHAIKKLLRAGKSVKSLEQDIDEVILTLTRWKEMIEEDKVLATGGIITTTVRMAPGFFLSESPSIVPPYKTGEL